MAAVTGVESLELAPMSADGSIPTTGWIKIKDIEDGGIGLNIPDLETVDVRVEDVTGIRFVLQGDENPAEMTGASLNLDIDKANFLFKGEKTTGATEFKSTGRKVHYVAARLTSKPFQGQKFQWVAGAMAITAGFKNNLNRAGFLALSFTGKATTPVDSTGAELEAWGYKFIDVVLPEG